METYFKDHNGVLCFKHAVEKAINGSDEITLQSYDDSDCGESRCWWIGGCYECEKGLKQ